MKRGNERLNSFIPDGSRVGGGYVVSVVDATLLLLETADLRRRRISTKDGKVTSLVNDRKKGLNCSCQKMFRDGLEEPVR